MDKVEKVSRAMHDIWCDTVLRHLVGDSADNPVVRGQWYCMSDMAVAAIKAMDK